MSARDERLKQALSGAGAMCGSCGDEPGDRTCPDCERARGRYVEAARAAGWAPRAEVLRQVADLWMERSTTATVPRERMDLRYRAAELREMADEAGAGDGRG